jgi:hypothetical protein
MITEIHPSINEQAEETAAAIERSVKLALGSLPLLRLENNALNGVTESMNESVASVAHGLEMFVTLTAASMLTHLQGI